LSEWFGKEVKKEKSPSPAGTLLKNPLPVLFLIRRANEPAFFSFLSTHIL
jgi:hypothetical protein